MLRFLVLILSALLAAAPLCAFGTDAPPTCQTNLDASAAASDCESEDACPCCQSGACGCCRGDAPEAPAQKPSAPPPSRSSALALFAMLNGAAPLYLTPLPAAAPLCADVRKLDSRPSVARRLAALCVRQT